MTLDSAAYIVAGSLTGPLGPGSRDSELGEGSCWPPSFLQDTPRMCEGRAHFALAQHSMSKSPWTSARSELTPGFPLRPAPAAASTLGVPAAPPGFGTFSPPALVPRLPQGLCTGQPAPTSPLRLCTGSPSWGGPTDPKPATLLSTPRTPPAAQSNDTLFTVGGCHLCSGPPAVGCPWSSPPSALRYSEL